MVAQLWLKGNFPELFADIYSSARRSESLTSMGTSTRHAIITASDSRYGDFLIDQWLASLHNVTLDGINVIVLDYGLTDSQRRGPGGRRPPLWLPQRRQRYEHPLPRHGDRAAPEDCYDQVLAIDGGDVISHPEMSARCSSGDKEKFRGVCEEIEIPFNDGILPRHDLSRRSLRKSPGSSAASRSSTAA